MDEYKIYVDILTGKNLAFQYGPHLLVTYWSVEEEVDGVKGVDGGYFSQIHQRT